MRLTVLGGCGAWPGPRQACSGYLLEHGGFRLLIDPGYAILPRLLETTTSELIDAVLISHSHADHCADLHPLLRSRALGDSDATELPVYSQPSDVDHVLALDRPGLLDDAYLLHPFAAGEGFSIGPFEIETKSLPHFVPNAGMRISVNGQVLAYSGDSGPDADLIALAENADVLLAEASFLERVPRESSSFLSSAVDAGHTASSARVRELILTHLLPGASPRAWFELAQQYFQGPLSVAAPGLVIELDRTER